MVPKNVASHHCRLRWLFKVGDTGSSYVVFPQLVNAEKSGSPRSHRDSNENGWKNVLSKKHQLLQPKTVAAEMVDPNRTRPEVR